ncbi:CDP-glycerol:poly(glycerophosphate) glycerophosphotransferase [Brevibacterium ravenspurgense]|uniref:CDP-glycerol:poly(Glycerophosphate) glycerophosphotransferase n=1 Tax=Brevibacterium ravenspurgense TaxID=479117 RepID=A0A150H9Y0_9MICO|nr:CDP-glycerol glycerophosphotransferase family protein [Brevibacterium ravenspurgense]KXZ58899.1 CDP-glycerol:poly(glycerophosphate) glycerophosphotransferase [Brevibacterium ravenspurgense]
MKQAVRKMLGRAVKRMPAETRRRVRDGVHPALRQRVVTLLTGSQSGKPKLSVIVPVYNVEPYIAKCLNSLIQQTYRNLEIIVVDDGSPDNSAAIARRYARWDNRVKVISKVNGGLGAARNTGLEYVTGDYLTFVDSDDHIPRDAYQVMMRTILRTGSDMVSGGVYRQKGTKVWLSAWTKKFHPEDRLGITIDDFPEIFEDAMACNKIFSMDFFRRAVGEFPVGIRYEDQEPMAKAYLRARSFDVLRHPVYYWLLRDDGSSITQGKENLDDLTDRLAVLEAGTQHVFNEGSEAARHGWFKKVLTGDLIQYLDVAQRTSQEYWDVFSGGLKKIVTLSGEDLWNDLPFWVRLPMWLAVHKGRSESFAAMLWRSEHGTGLKLKSNGAGFVVDGADFENRFGPLPQDILEVAPDSVSLNCAVDRVEWLTGSLVEIAGHAYCDHLIDGREATPRMLLINRNGDQEIELDAERFEPRLLNRFKSQLVSAQNAAYTVRINTEDLDVTEGWRLIARVSVNGIDIDHRAGALNQTAAAADPGFSKVEDGRRWVLEPSSDGNLWFNVKRAQVSADIEKLAERRFAVTIRGANVSGFDKLRIHNRRSSQDFMVSGQSSTDGSRRFEFVLPALGGSLAEKNADSTWTLRAVNGKKQTPLKPRCGFNELQNLRDEGSLFVGVTVAGNLKIHENPWFVTADSYAIVSEGGHTRMTFNGRFELPAEWKPTSLALRRDGKTVADTDVEWTDGGFAARVDLTTEDWFGNTMPLPAGGYNFVIEGVNSHTGATARKWVRLSEEAAKSLPEVFDEAVPAAIATRTAKTRSLWLRLVPPVKFAEKGTYNRARVIEGAVRAHVDKPLDKAILFESFFGKRAGDIPEPLYFELRKRLPDWKFYWSNAQDSFASPEGTETVITHSAKYIEALFTSQIIVNNCEFPSYFRKQPGQLYVQTWHGTPLKMIGADVHSAGLSPEYRAKVQRETQYWDILLAQSDFAAEKFDSAFSSAARTIVDGYPRVDVLANPEQHREARAKTRANLGLRNDEIFVLYAPTFRDASQKAGVGYHLDIGIDFERLKQALPSNVRLGIRAHSNVKAMELVGDEFVIDVTEFPDAQTLLAATDVLIADYSSIMFDFAATRRPMVFFAPDLEDYLENSRGMYLDYESTVPGPIVRTTAELGDALNMAITEGLDEYKDKYDEFVANYLPHEDGHSAERIADEIVRLVQQQDH